MEISQLRVAVAQFPAVNDIKVNQQYIQFLCEKANQARAQLLVLPEASMCSFASPLSELRYIAGEYSDKFIRFIQQLSQHYNLYIVAGVLSLSEAPEEERVINQLLVVDSLGIILTRYTKLHLYDAFDFKESDKVKPGEVYDDGRELGIFNIHGFKFGLINCYDLRFPELARRLAVAGVDVLSVSAAWLAGPYKEMHWDLLLRARAVENTCYVLGSGQTGPRNCGQSKIIDPMGSVLAGAGDQEGIAVTTLSKERISEVRKILPCLTNRRYAT